MCRCSCLHDVTARGQVREEPLPLCACCGSCSHALQPKQSTVTAPLRCCGRSLRRNESLNQGWQHLAGLRALTWLDLSYLRITSLPPVLAQLTGLRTLVLDQCCNLRR